MNLGGKGKKPTQPDPVVVSQAQTQSNQDTAAFNASLNRQNSYTPYGSQTFTQNGTDPVTGAPRWDERITLDPRIQQSFDTQLAQNNQMDTMAGGALDRAASSYSQPMDTSGVPALQGSPNMGRYQTEIGTAGLPQLQSELDVNGPDLVGQIDNSGMPQLYGADDLLGARQQTQDALYNRQAGYLDPQWQQREDRFRTRMANQGVVEGSEAWRSAKGDEDRARTFDYDQARAGAITGGGEEMSRLAGIASGNRAQTYGERATNAGFTNNARAQAMNEATTRGAFANSARAQGFNENAEMAGFYNDATGATNADALRSAAFGNDARAQGLDEAYTARNAPMREFQGMRDASALEIPQFNAPPTTSVAPTNTSDNVWRGYQSAVDMYNAGQSGNNAMFGGLAQMGGQLGSAWIARSDERLKDNIEHVGELADGTNVYDYDIDGRHERGVMAQEVEQRDPLAVMTGKDGYKRVNYTRVLARAIAA